MAIIVVMRLTEMRYVHPQQDNSRVCAKCGKQVGIYPSGQAMLKAHANMRVICTHCFDATPTPQPQFIILPPEVDDELSESIPASRNGAGR
jgi:DNA-directed RNA polymerase subunit RPC12/RpoP